MLSPSSQINVFAKMAIFFIVLSFPQMIGQNGRRFQPAQKPMSAFFVEGDSTDHSGKVLACSPEHKVGEKHLYVLPSKLAARRASANGNDRPPQ
jgi:hypothetical protein